jgi:RNA polymerase sigma-70 factor (ECF subfamily)
MEQLVKEVLAGKRGSATKFYQTYVSRVRGYLLARLPTEADAEDILQDTFLSAFDSLLLYRGDSSVATWLLSIARHEVADFYRKRYVRQAVEKTSPLFEEMILATETPEFVMEKSRLRKRFVAAYKSLSREHQDVLSFRFELGMSVKEIAFKMELSFKATESLLYRARRAFTAAYAHLGS